MTQEIVVDLSKVPWTTHRGKYEIQVGLESPLAAGLDIVGCDDEASGTLPAAGAAHPSCNRRVAEP